MRKALFLSIFALSATFAAAAEPAQCDATAFTLKKPALTAPQVKQPKVAVKARLAPAPAPAKTAKAKTTRLISDCKDDGKKRRN